MSNAATQNAPARKPFTSVVAAQRALYAASRAYRAVRLSDNADATTKQRAAEKSAIATLRAVWEQARKQGFDVRTAETDRLLDPSDARLLVLANVD
jgi:hypothetical protein